jgi:predicted Ser/Thr protein kinase
MESTKVSILNQEIDRGNEPSYYRMLVDEKYVKYISIDPGTYEIDDLCFPPILVQKLPRLPKGEWNSGRIMRTGEIPKPFFIETCRENFRSIAPLWHSKTFDYLSFNIGKMLTPNVYVASSPQFEKPIIVKYARFDWEIGYYVAETRAYSWIEGQNIGPAFLGHLTKGGRIIGFVLEHVEGRHATVSDLHACEALVSKMHRLGILHGDLNKYNFLVAEKGVVLVDFETAQRSEDKQAMRNELEGLKEQLLDESGRGGGGFGA